MHSFITCRRYLSQYDEVPFAVLNMLTAGVNYGGRVTDDKDLRTIDIILLTYYNEGVLKDNHPFSSSGLYYSPAYTTKDSPHESFMDYIGQLPFNPDPEAFDMHSNANITCAQNETDDMFNTILSLQPRTSAGAGMSREDVICAVAKDIEDRLPKTTDEEATFMKYPTRYEESMNTVLVQEVKRYNNLLQEMLDTLPEVQKALKGLVVMSGPLETMATSMYNQWVPEQWEAKAYPSLKPLAAWTNELLERFEFLYQWIEHGTPSAFWISGFFFPQAFTTGVLQNYARKYQKAIDTISFDFLIRDDMDDMAQGLDAGPENGAYVYGLFLEGARWCKETHVIAESLPKELYSRMAMLHLSPVQNRPDTMENIYRCPVYKVLTRAGTLSTTGHSTNFVMWMEIPSAEPTILRKALCSETNRAVMFADAEHWIKAGVACFCSLRY